MYAFAAGLLQPLPLALFGSLAATIWAWRRCPPACRRPLRVLAALLVVLVVCSTSVVGDLALWSLERGYPPEAAMPAKADVIIVLGSSERMRDEEGEDVELDADGTIRCLHAARVWRQVGPCPIVASGGRVLPNDLTPPVADVMRDFLIELGVAPDDILVEDTSRTTYENAVYSLDLFRQREEASHAETHGKKVPGPAEAAEASPVGLNAQSVVLVTDAMHMPRSVACFRALGVEVIPTACAYRASVLQWSPQSFLPSAAGANRFQVAVHEWVGILWYRLHGRL